MQQALLEQLYQGQDLSREQAYTLFDAVIGGKMLPEQIAALLIALKIKGEVPDEIAGAARAMVEHARPFPRPAGQVADCVGTGGDKSNTINISTASAVLLAACGVTVAKHGNRSVSSQSGSADLLEAFGVKLDAEPEMVADALEKTGFGFLFAPVYHAGMRYAVPVRKALKTRTLFNILGPLSNPARPDRMLLGVYDPALCQPMAETLRLLGCEKAMVVHGLGTDEMALHGATVVHELDGDTLRAYEVTPADFGLDVHPLASLVGGEPMENKRIIEALLAGEGSQAQRQALAINTGALLKLCGKADSFRDGAEQALAVLSSGKALETLNDYAELTRS